MRGYCDDRYEERNLMVEFQLLRRGINNKAVAEAMRLVPRHLFIPKDKQADAYMDTPLLIGEGQTISQPFMVAFMIQSLLPSKHETVLEIGTGSGYSAAVLAQVFKEVYTIERHRTLAAAAQELFSKLNYKNIYTQVGDGTKGWGEKAPFDAIVVAAGGHKVPQALKEQLEIGGRLVIPIGADRTLQILMRIRRQSEDSYIEESLGEVRFVPLIGHEGWEE